MLPYSKRSERSLFNLIKLFSGSGTLALANKIAQACQMELGDIQITKFSDGEIQPFYNESVRGCDVFLIQSTNQPNDHIIELLMMTDAAKRASADHITVVIPYFGLARQDRKNKPRVGIGAKLIANLITAAGAHRIITMDLHAAQIQGFFDIPVDHLDASIIFVEYIKALNLSHLTIASPDIGGAYRARSFANFFNGEVVICDKQRKRANAIEKISIIGDVSGKDIVLVDDICDTAQTLTRAATLIMKHGAQSVRAVCTHPILSNNAYQIIADSVLEELIVTDSIPMKQPSPKIKVLSSAELFANAIANVNEHKSIDNLFGTD